MILFYILVAAFVFGSMAYQVSLLVMRLLQVPSVVSMKWWEFYLPTLGPISAVAAIIVLIFLVAAITVIFSKVKSK